MIDRSKYFQGAYHLTDNNCFHYVNYMINGCTDTLDCQDWVKKDWLI